MTTQQFEVRARAAFEAMWRCSYAILQNSADCEDALQETLMRGWKNLGSLREEAYFETWLMRILINESRRILKRRAVRAEAPMDARIPAQDGLSQELKDAIARLPVRERVAFLLRYSGGYSISEIAGMQKIPYHSARRRIEAAKRHLAQVLKEDLK